MVKYFPAEWPFLRMFYQAVTHRIQANIFPFTGFAFRCPELVVVETILPPPGTFDAGEFVRVNSDAR